MINVKNTGRTNDFVYDISLDGTVTNALGCNICSNTDGFNFGLPDTFRYTEENPYIGKGTSRVTKEGKAYVGLAGDVAEFNEMYMIDFNFAPDAVQKMGLDVDEVVASTINFSRKNYADYFPGKPYPEDVKLVGNTVKSKKMPEYIAKFLAKGVRLLLNNKGKEFLDEYYNYVDKIYNYRIPLRDIASKGKVKKSIPDYIIDCQTLTAAGRPKSRQAWMELAIKNNLNVDMGDTIYYINTGKSKSQADAKKITKFFNIEDGEKIDITARIDREFKKVKSLYSDKNDYIAKTYPAAEKVEEIILNSELLPREIIESDNDVFCEEGQEYNVPLYLNKFNNRITPLLVCFSKDIRSKILIMDPDKRPYFTDEECKLVSGEPNKPGDQDTYEQLMTMEDKEIRFWMAHPEFKIPYLDACGMDWDKIQTDYLNRLEDEKRRGIDKIKEEYAACVAKLTNQEYNEFIDDGVIPASIAKIVEFNPELNGFVSPRFPDVLIGNITDIIDRVELDSEDFSYEKVEA